MQTIENTSRVMSGTFAQVWVRGELLAEASACQAKVSKNKSTISRFGQTMDDSKVTSMKGTGSITLNKVFSRFFDDAASAKAGSDVRSTIVMKEDDPDAFGGETVALYNCSFDDCTLFDLKAGSAGSTTHPFTFTDWKVLEAVDA